MGIIIRQSIQNTIIAYIGIALGFVSTILLFPHFLTADQYGLTRVLISLALVSAQFAHLGINKTIIRYFPYFDQVKNKRYELLTLSLVIPLVGFLLFTLLFFLFEEQLIYYYRDRSELFGDYHLYLLPLVFAMLFFEVLNNYVRALKDSTTGSMIREVLVRVIIIVVLVLYYFGFFDFPAFMILFVLAYAIQPVAMLIYLYVKKELRFSMPFKEKNWRFAKLISTYGGYTFLGGISGMLVGNLDILMLGSLTNLGNTAVYFIAFSVGAVIAVPQRSINKIAAPILADLLKAKRYAEISSLYKRTSLNQIIAGSLLFVGVWANMHNLLGLLPEEYQGAEPVILIIGFVKLIDMAMGINGGIIMHSRYYRFDLYTNIFLILLTIATNYLLIPPYGIVGAALATAISILVYTLTKFLFVWKKFSMQPFQYHSITIVILAAFCLWGSFQIPYLWNFYADVIIRSTTIAVVFLGAIITLNLSNDVRSLAVESLKRVRKLLG